MNQQAAQLIQCELALAGFSPDDEQRLRRLEERRITPDKELTPVEFLFRLHGKPCFARGELTGLSGKAKSGKTFVCSILMALCFRNEVLSVQRIEPRKLHVLWYDTEQSDESTQDILKNRILQMIGGHTDITDTTDNISANSALSAGQKKSVQSVKSVVENNNSVVCIVESEKTAVICSVVFPSAVWLSCGGLQMFKPELLAPLVAHKVILFPDTDEKGEAYKAWTAVAQQAQKLYPFQYPLRISPLLELRASEDQKRRKIDLVDFIFESV